MTGVDPESQKALVEALDSDAEGSSSGSGSKREKGGRALTESEAESILAAFLGTTPIGGVRKQWQFRRSRNHPYPSSQGQRRSTKPPATAPALGPTQNSTPSKRRSSRRDTTQSFGEKLPDLLTKTAQFDFSVMDYFRSIDRPGVAKHEEDDDDNEESKGGLRKKGTRPNMTRTMNKTKSSDISCVLVCAALTHVI